LKLAVLQKITTAHSQPLFNVAATRQIEQRAASTLPSHALMQRAGLAVARLALAIAPHAQCIWVACGPGNNGGDGFEAARHLHQWGKRVVVTWTGAGKNGLPPDAEAARTQALAAGVTFAVEPPPDFDFCIDALLGIGGTLDPAREGTARILQWLQVMTASTASCLAVDLPSRLSADTGAKSATLSGASCARIHWAPSKFSRFTLSLLTLKPGLFTFEGRDSAGEVWFDDLGVDVAREPPSAWLLGADRVPKAHRLHSSHKGSFGDVAVIGGESTADSHMAGAALLAASAALHAGAGRVFVALLGDAAVTVNPSQPELMFRDFEALDLRSQVVVCGCGGGQAVKAVLPKVLSTATRLVLDADALNAIANDTTLQTLLKARAAREDRGFATVLTPHPLEAARLLQTTTAQVQSDRLKAAAQLAELYQAVVVLKGSGSVIAAPGQTSCINASGNALLATAGTGDVLAGTVGSALASGLDAFNDACVAVFRHGQVADDWEQTRPGEALTASRLATSI
jgi:ADP-dependent NAD(P)H-hydrate dehydratase / NAD(P)H-hydrate epimerase